MVVFLLTLETTDFWNDQMFPPLTFLSTLDPVVLLPLKPSTNGTWFRLSGMHAESRPYPLSNGSEILIGTVRAFTPKAGSQELVLRKP